MERQLNFEEQVDKNSLQSFAEPKALTPGGSMLPLPKQTPPDLPLPNGAPTSPPVPAAVKAKPETARRGKLAMLAAAKLNSCE